MPSIINYNMAAKKRLIKYGGKKNMSFGQSGMYTAYMEEPT